MVTRPGTNRARRALTSFKRRTPLTITPRRQRGGDAACSCRYSSRLLVCVWPRMSRALLLSRPWSWTTSWVARRHSTAKCRAASQASSATTSRTATASSTLLTQLTHAHARTHAHTHARHRCVIRQSVSWLIAKFHYTGPTGPDHTVSWLSLAECVLVA